MATSKRRRDQLERILDTASVRLMVLDLMTLCFINGNRAHADPAERARWHRAARSLESILPKLTV